MEVKDFAEIEAAFLERVNEVVWCTVATVDSKGRPRSRVLHPIWEGQTGWIATTRTSYKARNIANNPHVSLSYVKEITKPTYVDCVAAWVDDLDEKRRIWELYKNAPEPMGYDPAMFWGTYDNEQFGLLKLTPWRIELVTFPAPALDASPIWRRPAEGQ